MFLFREYRRFNLVNRLNHQIDWLTKRESRLCDMLKLKFIYMPRRFMGGNSHQRRLVRREKARAAKLGTA
jgi:hypothetical protein